MALACVYARVGRVDDAIVQLKEATRNVPGFVADWPLHDPDLQSLHEHPEFIRMFGRARAGVTVACPHGEAGSMNAR